MKPVPVPKRKPRREIRVREILKGRSLRSWFNIKVKRGGERTIRMRRGMARRRKEPREEREGMMGIGMGIDRQGSKVCVC